MEHSEHGLEVKKWLDKNVRAYRTPGNITLTQFKCEWSAKGFKGEALLLHGENVQGEVLSLRMGEIGWVTYTPPMFQAPMCAPASYAAIKLTQNTRHALFLAMRGLLPRLLPLGLHPVSKKWITMQTPLKDRVVDSVALQAALDLLAQPGYKLVQAVPQT